MLVHIEERILLLDILYEMDRYIPLPELRALYAQVYITEDEITNNSFYIKDGKYGWSNDIGREIHFSPDVRKMLRIALESFNNKGKLTDETIALYELFCDGE